MDNSLIPEELLWTEADQAKFGTPHLESAKQIKHETEGGSTANESKVTLWKINGLEAASDEVERAVIQAIKHDGTMVSHLALFLATCNQNFLDDVPILEG